VRVDCDDIILVIANRASSTMTGLEKTRYHDHVSGCLTCQQLVSEGHEEDWRWIVRVPADTVDGSDILSLPMVDPIVFAAPEELSSGGMGRITKAFDRRLGREIAVKELLDRDLRSRFEREVLITARLQHPAIVPIYEAGVFPDGSAFYTMRLVPGRTLAQAIDEATTLEARLRLMPHLRAAAEAVAYAHARGVIHRDLKPGNILVGEFGETVVIDWGLAKEVGHADVIIERPSLRSFDLTRVGSVLGTPCFMSPAQAAGTSVTPADDVYALGAMLYNLLAGAPPYWDTSAHDSDALLAATTAGLPTPIATLADGAPADLHAIVERAMARDRATRFPTATELIEELARFEAGQLLVSRTYSARELFIRWLRRHRIGVSLAALCLIAATVVSVLFVRLDRAATELAIRERGGRLTDLYGEVARQAYVIDRDLLRLENALEGLTVAAAWALEGSDPGIEPVYFDTDFKDPARRPADFTDQTKYRWPVSVAYPVVGLAPGTDPVLLLPDIRRVVALRHHIRAMVLEAASRGEPRELLPAVANQQLLSRAGPIDYAYVDLPEGVIVMWPGFAGLRSDYDVRTASFYKQSANQHGRRWGAPYVDSTTDRAGDDLVLPCTKAVWSSTGTFLGVAGVEMTVTKMVDTSMRMGGRETFRTSLVDDLGRKVIDSRDANRRFVANGRDEAIEFEPFDLPHVAEAIRNRREGVEETTRDGRPIVVAFVRLDAIKWYFVVEVDGESLGVR